MFMYFEKLDAWQSKNCIAVQVLGAIQVLGDFLQISNPPPQCSDVFVSRARRVQEKLDAVRLRLAGTAADGFVRSLAVYEKPRDGETRVRVKGLEEKGVHFNGRMGHVLGIVPGLKAEDKTRFRSVVAREKSSVSG